MTYILQGESIWQIVFKSEYKQETMSKLAVEKEIIELLLVVEIST